MKNTNFKQHFKPAPKLVPDFEKMLPPQKIRITETEFYAKEIGKPTASSEEWQIDMHAYGKRGKNKPAIYIMQYVSYKKFSEVMLYWIFAFCRLYKTKPTDFCARLYNAVKAVEDKGGDIFEPVGNGGSAK